MAQAPAVFISHGDPGVALQQDDYTAALRRFGARHAGARALVVMSAHFESTWPIRITSSAHPPLIHDFAGFPDSLYRLAYEAPGAPDLAERIAGALQQAGLQAALDPVRGWDHGVWIPLRIAWPEASVPVVEISLPRPASPGQLQAIGRALRPIRDEGAILIGSGGVVHNLRRVRFEDPLAPVEEWARRFDDWVAVRLQRSELEALALYQQLAPHAAEAAPTTEHFDPLFFVLGAAGDGAGLIPIHEGFRFGNLSMRCFAFEQSAGASARGEAARPGSPPGSS